MKKIFLFYLLTICAVNAQKQPLVLNDSLEYFDIWGKENTEYFEDKERFLSFDEINKKKFFPTKGLKDNFGFTNSSFWVRFKLKKDSLTTKSWIIGTGFVLTDTLELYVIDKFQKISSHKLTGRLVPHYLQAIDSHDKIFPLELKTNELYTIYLRVAGSSSKKVSISIEETHLQNSSYQKRTWFWAAYLGFYLTMILVQIVFFLITRNMNSLYYMFYLMAFLIVEVSRGNGMFGDRYIWADSLWFKTNSLLIGVPVATIFGMWFYANGLQLLKKSKLMFYILIIDAIILSLFSIKVIFWKSNVNVIQFVLLLSLVSDFLVLIACIIVWRKGYKPARFYLIGTVFFFLGIIATIFWHLGLLPYNVFTNQALNFACILEMIFFTAAIADEHRLSENEKIMAKSELIEGLKTKNAEISDALLKGQTIERQRVALDLHDNLGSTLSALWLSVDTIDKSKMNVEEKEIHQNLRENLEKAYNDVRLLSHNLLPEEFEKQGLTIILQGFVRKMNKNSTIKFDLKISEDFGRVDNKIEFELYSICLELVNNIIKHSKASEGKIELSRTEKQILLTVSDNGIGTFKNDSDGKGMKNVKARVESLNGVWELQNIDSQGVRSEILISV